MDDSKIVEEIMKNPQSGLKYLIDKYHSLIYTVCKRILTSNEEDIEECVNDTFVKIWESIDTIKEPDKLKSFACCVARNTAINKLKQIKRQNTDELDETIISSESTPEQYFELKESSEHLHNAIMQLKEPDREVFVRKYFYSETSKAIGSRLGLSEKKINNILYLSKKFIKNILMKGEIFDEK